ncbi:MAG: DUF1800 domain-containing protein, partial [Acidobacteriota bacterium]
VSAARMTEEQSILHVLNRLGFGARPGDIERVKGMGIQKYIELQLNPTKIPDALAEAKVKDLATLSMTTAQLYEKYPQPGQILRQLQRRGDLPSNTGVAADNKGADAGANPPESNSGTAMTPDSMTKKGAANPNPAAAGRNEDSRRAIREYYAQNGLLPPQRIVAELQASRILRATYSERQLQEVLVDFWTNHFNVFAGKGADRWLLVSYDRDTIRPNTIGKFRDLLLATAQSPAMLFYLDNFQSVSPNSQVALGGDNQRRRPQGDTLLGNLLGRKGRREPLMDRNPNLRQQQGAGLPQQPPANAARQRRGINENYARELMELHTLGVDGGYTQKDVQEVARCFTGWTIFAPRGGGAAPMQLDSRRAEMLRENAGKFFFNQRAHDDGEKVVLGQKIPAGGGFKDGLMVLDILSRHPATAKFIATKLSRYFVDDNPSPALVDRVAAAFTRSDGDIRETLKAIFSSPEFNSPAAYRAKVKRPFELAISAMRTLGAETTGGPQLHQWIARMGEPLYGYQTPNGYADTAESWVNTGGLLERLNFGLALASNRIPGTRVDLKQFLGAEAGANPDKAIVMDRFLKLIVAGNVSAKTRETLLKQLDQELVISSPAPVEMARTSGDAAGNRSDEMPGDLPADGAAGLPGDLNTQRRRGRQLARADANITDPVTKIVGLILGSPEFQRQ